MIESNRGPGPTISHGLPDALLPAYRHLIYSKRVPAAEAKRMVLERNRNG